MSSAEALRTVHVFLLVAWLGIDVGVFTSSFVIRRRGIPARGRIEIRRIMRGLDLAPRLSLVLMIPVAISMARAYGLGAGDLPGWLVWLVAVVSLLWCGAIVWAYQRVDPLLRPKRDGDAAAAAVFARTDYVLRLIASAFFLVTGVHSIVATGLWGPTYVAWKATLFGLAIVAGLWIRTAARPFTPALRQIVDEGETDAALEQMDRAMHHVYPAVLTIWTLVVAAAVVALTN